MTTSLVQERIEEPGLAAKKASSASRLDSMDALRGLVMILMAIDHTRDFLGPQVPFRGVDVVKLGAPLFFTRWITHFCAPVFVLLAGTAAFFQAARGKTPQELSKFLLTRGVWLVFLELTVIRLGWMFDLSYSFGALQVIWAIGWSMIVLAALVFLPSRIIGGFGLLMISLHNLLDGISPNQLGSLGGVWAILHQSKPLQIAPGHTFFVVYPLIPWIGVMATGYALGAYIDVESSLRKQRFFRLGAACLAAFLLLRGLDVYGDPLPRQTYDRALYTLLSFLNCTKYPPSLSYLLMTLGPSFVALGLMEGRDYPGKSVFLVFGRAPLFYYILHLYLIHAGAIALLVAVHGLEKYRAAAAGNGMPADMLFGLPMVYLCTAIFVAMLYPVCRWFAELKRRRRDIWWLSYL